MSSDRRRRTLWLGPVGLSLSWSMFVIVHVLGNGLRSAICGAGLLESLQLLFVGLVWLPLHVSAFWATARRRWDRTVEAFTLALALLALWAQLQWEPACSAYQ